MADSDINVERFAHDVCVHVLEKFDIFKAPDDTRKHNNYTSTDFLSRVSGSVVLTSICIRDNFKSVLEDTYKTSDKEKIWTIFDYLRPGLALLDSTGKICLSLAACSEYIQFVNTKDFTVSLNKLIIIWSDFFEKNLRMNFESEGGFSNLYSNLRKFGLDRNDNLYTAIISEYCVPYGAKECTKEIFIKCVSQHGMNPENKIYIVNYFSHVLFAVQRIAGQYEKSPRNRPGSESSKAEETKSDSKGSSGDTDTSEKTELEMLQNIGSEANDSEMLQNDLLGIPPHEEMLRKIDPFFVENIPSPPKRRSASKSPERQSGSNDCSRSASKSLECEPCSSDDSLSSTKQEELQEKVELILSKMEHDMESLKALLFEHNLISMKSGRRRSRMRIKDVKDKIPPQSPEGLV